MSPPALPAPVPVRFDTDAGWCFGWYHAPQPAARDRVVVLCPPIGYEAVCSYPNYVQLASHLAAAGLPVFRFDYQGTGDSSGSDRQPGRLDAWRDSVDGAIREARRLSGASQVALFGLRLGATLAVEAAARIGGVEALLLWAPCPTGKAFARELRASGVDSSDGSLLAMGTHYRADTLAALATLDATRPGRQPAARALVIGRDDLPLEGPLPKALAAAGVVTDYRVLPGYAALVGEPREGVLAAATLDLLAGWLKEGAPVRSELAAPVPPRLEGCATEGVRETPVRFGPRSLLFGILAEPQGGAEADRKGQTGIVLLNVGGNYRIGPHRVYVHMARALARAGYRVLRMDLAGIGDSPPEPGQPWANLYAKESSADVRAALDLLALQGCREFVLMGICSGSYVAFQTALVEPRVHGIVLMNSRLLEWTPGRAGDTWQNSMQQYAKSTDWYRRALLRPQVWGRLLRGEVNVRLIAGRFLALAWARLQRLFAVGDAGQESLLAKMKRLCRRGTDVLMLVSDADDGRDYVEFHFGRDGRRMRSHRNFRLLYVPEADHTFSRPGNQDFVIPLLLRHLEQRPAPTPSSSGPDATVFWAGAANPGA